MNRSPFARHSMRRHLKAGCCYLSGLSAGILPWPRGDSRTRAHVRPRGVESRGLLRVERIPVRPDVPSHAFAYATDGSELINLVQQ